MEGGFVSTRLEYKGRTVYFELLLCCRHCAQKRVCHLFQSKQQFCRAGPPSVDCNEVIG